MGSVAVADGGEAIGSVADGGESVADIREIGSVADGGESSESSVADIP